MTDPVKSERERVAAETRASLQAEEAARLAAIHARRRRYWENGYRPIEIWSHDRRFADNGERLTSPGKQPRGRWREAAKRNPPDAVTRAPYAGATNTGISCEDEIIGADVDVPVQDLADQVVVVAEARFGITPLVRIGLAPKILLVYRGPPEAFGKIQTPGLFLPDGTKLKVELLANGQQFVVDGIHPDTGKPYIWTGASPEDVRREELPEITEEAARTFIAEVEEQLRAAGAKPKEKPGKGTNNAPRPSIPPGAKGGDPGSRGDGFFRAVNAAALADIAAWAPGLLPRGHWEDRTGAWRISSSDLGRMLQEDLSIHPGGIRDFGTEETLTPIDVVIRYDSERSKPLAAARWLCERLGVDPTSLGWCGGNGIDEAGLARLENCTGPTSENIEPEPAGPEPQPPGGDGRDPEPEEGSDNPKVAPGGVGGGPPPPPGDDPNAGTEGVDPGAGKDIPSLPPPPPPEPEPEPEPEPIGPRPAPFSHEWMALNFSAEHHVDWRYVALWGKWQQWAGTRWRSEETLRAFELARRVCRAASHECDDEKVAREVARASSVAGVERLARADRRHAMRFYQYDAKDWDFNQPRRKE